MVQMLLISIYIYIPSWLDYEVLQVSVTDWNTFFYLFYFRSKFARRSVLFKKKKLIFFPFPLFNHLFIYCLFFAIYFVSLSGKILYFSYVGMNITGHFFVKGWYIPLYQYFVFNLLACFCAYTGNNTPLPQVDIFFFFWVCLNN